MSLFKEEHLECPFCHQDVPFILHHSINVGIHPEHKAKVLDNTLFRYQCPHCKQTDEVCYPTLYHDPENEIMIQVLWREEDFGQQMDKELQSLIEVMGLAVLPARLKTEMAILKDAILENKDIKADERIAKHYDWTMKIKAKYDDINADNCDQIIRDEIGIVFTAILGQCGVFDRTEEGRKQFKKFIASVK